MTQIDYDADLTFSEYQLAAGKTAVYPESGQGTIGAVSYTVLGLTNEAGEVAGKLKKVMRDNNGVLSPEKRKEIADEVSDVLWYLTMTLDELGFSLETVAANNIAKLRSRQERGVLQGSGDNR